MRFSKAPSAESVPQPPKQLVQILPNEKEDVTGAPQRVLKHIQAFYREEDAG